MDILKKVIKFWNKPFPEESWFGLSNNILIISVSMTMFLYIFQPSGISDIEPLSKKFLVCFGFGVSGALAYYLFEVVFNQINKIQNRKPNWTFGKWWLYSLGVLFTVSLANFLYIRIFFFGYIIWNLFPYMLYGVFMFGIPVLILATLILWNQDKKYALIAQEINLQKTDTNTTSPAFNNNIIISDIPVHQIRYIESLQNYVLIGFINSVGQFKKETIRGTLKNILQEAKGSSIVRTHRSFLVNQDAIIETSGNAQGLLLTLSDCEVKVPVSRTYVPAFKST